MKKHLHHMLLPALFLVAPYTIAIQSDLSQNFGANFVHAMRFSPFFNSEDIAYDATWHTVKFVYDKHMCTLFTDTETTQIPRIIHQIWLPEGEVPAEFNELHQTWIKHHPDWHYKLWRMEDIVEIPFQDKEMFLKLSLEEKSIFARYAILYMYGGIFANSCCECLKSFEALHERCDFYAGIFSEQQFLLSDSIIAAKAGSQLIARCMFALCYDDIANIHMRSIAALTSAFKNQLLATNERIVALPLLYLDPWPRTEENMPDITKRARTRDSFAKKHWELLLGEKCKQKSLGYTVCSCPQSSGIQS